MSSGFSLLDEAWGSHAMPLPPRSKSSSTKRRKKFASRLAPLCEAAGKVAETGFPDSFQDTLAPFEPIYVNDDDAREVSKKKSRRSRSKSATGTVAPPPPPEPSPPLPRNEDDYDYDTEEEQEEYRGGDKPVVCPPCPPQQIIRYAEPPRPPSDDRYDTFLYVFSGVLLLFLLEQFLQIGIHIGRASRF